MMEAEEDIDLGVKPRAHALNQGLQVSLSL